MRRSRLSGGPLGRPIERNDMIRLVGPGGAGKSAAGALLAQQLGVGLDLGLRLGDLGQPLVELGEARIDWFDRLLHGFRRQAGNLGAGFDRPAANSLDAVADEVRRVPGRRLPVTG